MPRFVRYVEEQQARGGLRPGDPIEAAEAFLGLLLGDAQVRRLLGVLEPLGDDQIDARARRAAEWFLTLFGAE